MINCGKQTPPPCHHTLYRLCFANSLEQASSFVVILERSEESRRTRRSEGSRRKKYLNCTNNSNLTSDKREKTVHRDPCLTASPRTFRQCLNAPRVSASLKMTVVGSKQKRNKLKQRFTLTCHYTPLCSVPSLRCKRR